jgi:hypothetical protein
MNLFYLNNSHYCVPLAWASKAFIFLYRLRLDACKFCLYSLCVIAFQISAQTLQQELNDLPIINVNIASMDFPPNAHQSKDGRVSGKAIETIRAFCTVSRMNCEIIIYPTARAYMTIENRTSDVLLTANISTFEQCCTYSQWSYSFIAGIITELPIDNTSINEATLEGQSLVMVRGWQSIYDAFPNLKNLVAAGKVELIETSSTASAIKIYNTDKASLLWGANIFEWYFDKLSMQWDKKSFKPMLVSDAGIWVSKESMHHKHIITRFNLAYQLLKEQGNLGQDNFLVPALMEQVYIEAATPN